MSDAPLTSLHHSIYPLVMRLLVVIDQLLDNVCCNAGYRPHGRVIMTPVDIAKRMLPKRFPHLDKQRLRSVFSAAFYPCIPTNIPFFFTRPNIPFLPVSPETPSFRRAPVFTDQDKLAYMAAVNRSILHNAFIYSSDDLNVLLGGLWVIQGITNANLYSMMEIFCTFSDTFDLHYHRGPLVERDDSQLQPGDYFVVTNGRSPPPFMH